MKEEQRRITRMLNIEVREQIDDWTKKKKVSLTLFIKFRKPKTENH